MRARIVAAFFLWVLAGTGIFTLAAFHNTLALVPGLLWITMSAYAASSIGYKALLFPSHRFLALGFGLLSPLVTRIDPSTLENKNRKKVLAYIEKNPGASIQEVRHATSIAWGTAVYHLDRLRRNEKVVSHRHGNHHRYWAANTPESRVRRGWSVLEQETARDIAMAVVAAPGAHQGAICEAANVRAPSASKHLSRLEQHGLVEKHRISRYTVYQATPELERILRLQGLDETPRPAPYPLEET